MVAATYDAAVVDRGRSRAGCRLRAHDLGSRSVEEIFVGRAAQVCALGDGYDIAMALTQLLSNHRRIQHSSSAISGGEEGGEV